MKSVAEEQAALFLKWDKRLKQIGKSFIAELADHPDSEVNDLAKAYADELSHEGINSLITFSYLMKLAGRRVEISMLSSK